MLRLKQNPLEVQKSAYLDDDSPGLVYTVSGRCNICKFKVELT